MRRTQVVYEGDSLGQRLGRFVAFIAVLFFGGAGVVAASKFSSETLALIVGLLLAGIPMLAITGLLFFVLIRQGRRQPAQPQQMTIPPIMLTLPQQPQALPGDGGMWDMPQRERAAAARSWDVLGDD